MPILDFWYDFASTYSYPAALRIEAVAVARNVSIRWRPFLLGPIFAAQGMRDSPFNLFPRKGEYMWRDLERICRRLDLPIVRPDPFPQNSLHAARVTLALEAAHRAAFSRAVYAAEFADGLSIADEETLRALLARFDPAPDAILARSLTPEVKDALKQETATAAALGIIGAPSFVTAKGEVFWGNDRLEEALDWAAGE